MKMGSSPVLKCNRATQQPDNNKTRSVHMKLFQKSALALAIAAVPFLSVNAMEALDDATLSNMTGQAGVTIETTVDGTQGITIGSIEYTDTGSGATGGGSLVINGVNPGDAGVTLQGQVWDSGTNTWINGNSTTAQTIDIDEHGNLITETKAVDGFRVGAAGTADEGINIGAQKISVGQVLLRSKVQQTDGTGGAQLVSGLEMTIESGDSSAHILNLSGDQAERTAAIGNYKTAHTSSATIDKGLAGADATGASLAIVSKGKSRISNLNVNALDGAIGITGLSYGGGDDGTELMDSTQVIWAKGGNAYATQADVDANRATAVGQNLGGGVYIQGSDSVGTLNINSIAI